MQKQAQTLGLALGPVASASLITLTPKGMGSDTWVLGPPTFTMFAEGLHGQNAWMKMLLPNDDSVKAFGVQMVEVAILMGADKAVAQKDILEAVEFNVKLAAAVASQSNKPLDMSLKDIMAVFPEISLVLPSPPQPGDVFKTTDYIKALLGLLQATPPRTVANYLGMVYVYNWLDRLGDGALKEHLKFQRSITGKGIEKHLVFETFIETCP